MAEKLDLDALERANLGRVVRPEDWMALLAYARDLERRAQLRSMLLREQTDRLGAANLRVIELESAIGTSIEYDMGYKAGEEFAAEKIRLESASQRDAWRADAERLDRLGNESWDLRSFCIGEEDVGWRVIEFHQAAPHERLVAEVYKDDPRAAIDAAMKRSGEQKA